MREAMYFLAYAIITAGCSVQPDNVLLQEWEVPFQTPPFDEIEDEHFMPAFLKAMEAEKAEVVNGHDQLALVKRRGIVLDMKDVERVFKAGQG